MRRRKSNIQNIYRKYPLPRIRSEHFQLQKWCRSQNITKTREEDDEMSCEKKGQQTLSLSNSERGHDRKTELFFAGKWSVSAWRRIGSRQEVLERQAEVSISTVLKERCRINETKWLVREKRAGSNFIITVGFFYFSFSWWNVLFYRWWKNDIEPNQLSNSI